MKNKKPFVKINFEDLEYAQEFFENQSDYILWLYAVTEYYQGREITIKKKIVKKYFDNYKKTMNIVIEAKEYGKKGALKRIENQQDIIDTLEDPPQDTHKDTLAVNNKIVNNKEIIYKENLFDNFWKLYDKQIDRKKCYDKFMKLKDEEIKLIFERLPHYIRSTPDKQFRKNPTTWINGKCWNDVEYSKPQLIVYNPPIIHE